MSNIYITGLCGEVSEDWAFWSPNTTWETLDPDFTLCFQKSIFQWLPSGYLLLAAIFYLPYLWKRPTQFHSKISKFNLFKVMTCFLLVFLGMIDFFKTIAEQVNGNEPEVVLYTHSLFGIATWCLAAYLIRLEFMKAIHSSGILFWFWFLNFVIGILVFRSDIRHASLKLDTYDNFRSNTSIVAFFVITFLFFAHCFSDKAALDGSTWEEDDGTNSSLKKQERKPLLGFSNGISLTDKGSKKYTGSRKIPCPESSSSYLARLTFFWMMGLIYTGYRRALTSNDLTDLRPEDKCETIVPKIVHNWKKAIHDGKKDPKKKVSVLQAITGVFGFEYALTGLFKLLFDFVTFLQPQILNVFIDFISTETEYVWRGFFLGACLFLVAMTRTLIFQQYWHGCYVTGMQVRTAVIGLVYRKALKLSGSARKETTVGEIVNLMSVDAQKLQEVPGFLHLVWTAPITIVVALFFLWQELGPSALAGLGVMILLIPINGVLATKIKKFQYAQMRWKDKRIKMMSEILSGIRVLKLYAWEKSFQTKVSDIREEELRVLRRAAYLNAITAVCWFCTPFLVALSTFALYVLSSPENVLTPNKAFVSLSLFNILNFPISMLPGTISYMIQAGVSISRINKYLLGEELDPQAVENLPAAEHPIKIENGFFGWGKDDEPVLKNINLQIPDGGLVAVVGQVGTGKTSLISAMLGELHRFKGRVMVRGDVAYVPQQAWCQNTSLKENITFGKTLHSHKYSTVIEACALKPDIEILPGGDQTEIGEKGINLSGGQKQRISLARAVYQDANIYLLDDPLSAVDSHVGKHIFNQVLGPKGMLGHKTRVLVTHSITYLSQVDCIVVMKDGQVSEIGTYRELLSHNGPFAEFIRAFLDEEEDSDAEEIDHEAEELRATLRRTISVLSGDEMSESEGGMLSDGGRRRSGRSTSPSGRRLRSRSQRRASVAKEELENVKKKTLIQEESAETGSVKLSVFVTYLRSTGFLMVFLTVLTYGFYLGCQVGTNIWLSNWSEAKPVDNSTQAATELRDFYLGIYGALGFGQALFIALENLCVAYGTNCASRIQHDVILRNIMRAPSSFFDTTPLGRIVNRFGKDIDTVDINLPITFRIWLATFAGVLTSIIVISTATPQFLAALIPLGFLYYFAQRFYISTSRQLKRIDSIKRSPIYSHFQESIVGAPSIRAYKKGDDFVEKSDKLVDENQMAWYPNIVSYRWLGVTLESLGNLVILSAALFAVVFREQAGPGFAGLSVTYALQITGALNYMVRMSCDMETYVVAVERIHEYGEIQNEAPWIMDTRPPSNWPSAGKVEFQNYSVRYRPGLELVLKNISALVNPGQKVGIVGRTGAGKSSLTLALFRILEPATGTILLDDIDITRIGLHDLRQKLTIIPQDPVLFSGSLRMNLDPFDIHTDGEVWTALELAHLKTFVAGLTEGLAYVCSEGGENLSVGQRQLVCLARALLRKTRILVLDEATAAVDLETDELIQSTIRREFKHSTVLTIAHRLNTIMDYDKVMVLDKGAIREFDSPQDLLKQSNTIFYGMAHDAGLV